MHCRGRTSGFEGRSLEFALGFSMREKARRVGDQGSSSSWQEDETRQDSTAILSSLGIADLSLRDTIGYAGIRLSMGQKN